jgi:hypothetical protein
LIAVGGHGRAVVELNCRMFGEDPHAADYEPGKGE